MTPAWIEPATFRFVAQHLNHFTSCTHWIRGWMEPRTDLGALEDTLAPIGTLTPYRSAHNLFAKSITLTRRVRNLLKQNKQSWSDVRAFSVNTLHKYLTVSLRWAECEGILRYGQAVNQTVVKEAAFHVRYPTPAEQQACRYDRPVFFYLQLAEHDFK